MSDKYCSRCGFPIRSPDEDLCTNCIDKRLNYSEFYYDTWDLHRMIGKSERTVRIKAHDGKIPGKVPGIKQHLFKKGVIDEWYEAGQPIPKVLKTPTNPLQEEAAARCRKKDHSWLSEPKYDGIAYTSEETTIKQTEYTVLAGYNRTCYFCKYSTFVLA